MSQRLGCVGRALGQELRPEPQVRVPGVRGVTDVGDDLLVRVGQHGGIKVELDEPAGQAQDRQRSLHPARDGATPGPGPRLPAHDASRVTRLLPDLTLLRAPPFRPVAQAPLPRPTGAPQLFTAEPLRPVAPPATWTTPTGTTPTGTTTARPD